MSCAQRRVLLAVLAVALLLRIAAAVFAERQLQGTGQRFLIPGDAEGYWELGLRIARGDDYAVHQPPRYVLRTPGYPLLLAGIIRITGDCVLCATFVMAVIGASCCGLTWLLGRRLTDDRTAIVAALWVAVSPLQIGNSVLILSETWFAFWLLLCLLALSGLSGRWSVRTAGIDVSRAGVAEAISASCGDPPPGHGTGDFCEAVRAAVSGLLTGIGVLVRPGWILWPASCGLLLLVFGHGPVKRRCASAVLIGLGCLVALTPWALRNHRVTGHWILTSLWSGPSLYDGLHPAATGASDMTFVDTDGIYGSMSEFDANAYYKRRAWEFVRADPVRAVELGVIKARRYLSLTPQAAGFSGGILAQVCLAYYTAFSVAVFLGVWEFRRRPALVLLLAGPFLQFLLVHMVFVGSIRYRLPVEFPLSVLAAAGTRRIGKV